MQKAGCPTFFTGSPPTELCTQVDLNAIRYGATVWQLYAAGGEDGSLREKGNSPDQKWRLGYTE